jgi:hypothetical protein
MHENNELKNNNDDMEKAYLWTRQQAVDQYIADQITSAQEDEAAQIIGSKAFLSSYEDVIKAKKEIEGYKKTDPTKYYQIMAETRTLLGPDKWDTQVKDRIKNLQAWATEYIKVDFESAKKGTKTSIELIDDAFAQAASKEQKVAYFMMENSTRGYNGKCVGGNQIYADNENEARKIIKKYKLDKPEVYKDLVKRAGWNADYQNKLYGEDTKYRNECNTPFQPEASGAQVNVAKFIALSIADCDSPLAVSMQSAFDHTGNTVIGEFDAVKEKLRWSYVIKCVSYNPDAIKIETFLDKVTACFQAKTNDEKRISLMVNGRGSKNIGSYRGLAWKIGTCQITATFIKKEGSLREKDSPQYDSGKEMVPVHYNV